MNASRNRRVPSGRFQPKERPDYAPLPGQKLEVLAGQLALDVSQPAAEELAGVVRCLAVEKALPGVPVGVKARNQPDIGLVSGLHGWNVGRRVGVRLGVNGRGLWGTAARAGRDRTGGLIGLPLDFLGLGEQWTATQKPSAARLGLT